MASVFGDESADETKQRVFAIACALGTDEQWGALVEKWTARTGGKIFHAATCESEYADDPDRDKHKQNLALYKDLTQLIVGSGLHGWGVGLDLASFTHFFPGSPADIAYFKCFAEVVKRIIHEGQQRGDRDLKFTFDNRQESDATTAIIYDWMVNSPEWVGDNIFLDYDISFSSIKNPRIQVADLLARETMKYLDNHLQPESKRRPTRGSMRALATASKRFQFDYLVGDYFKDWKEGMAELSRTAGFSEKDYMQWLVVHKQTDNFGNRMRFLIWFESQELRKIVRHREKLR